MTIATVLIKSIATMENKIRLLLSCFCIWPRSLNGSPTKIIPFTCIRLEYCLFLVILTQIRPKVNRKAELLHERIKIFHFLLILGDNAENIFIRHSQKRMTLRVKPGEICHTISISSIFCKSKRICKLQHLSRMIKRLLTPFYQEIINRKFAYSMPLSFTVEPR